MDYKADTTLNERDSLTDILEAEKSLVKLYSSVMTESCSEGFRSLVQSHWNEAVSDQLDVFLLMTDHDYYRVESASEEQLFATKDRFKNSVRQLS